MLSTETGSFRFRGFFTTRRFDEVNEEVGVVVRSFLNGSLVVSNSNGNDKFASLDGSGDGVETAIDVRNSKTPLRRRSDLRTLGEGSSSSRLSEAISIIGKSSSLEKLIQNESGWDFYEISLFTGQPPEQKFLLLNNVGCLKNFSLIR